MIKLKYRSWTEIPLYLGDKLKEIIDSDINQNEKNLQILAALCETSVDVIKNANALEIKSLISAVNNTDMRGEITAKRVSKKHKTFELNCKVYNVSIEPDQMTYSQFVDFQEYIKEKDKNKAELMSTILIPQGAKYNDGSYSMTDLIEEIYNFMSVQQFYDFFFTCCIALKVSLKNSLLSLLKMRQTTAQTKKEIKELLKAMK